MRRTPSSITWLALCGAALGCASTSSWDRPLSSVRSRGWTVDVVSRLSNRYEPPTLFAGGLDQWPVEVELRARRSGEPILLGTLWFWLDGGEDAARRLHESLAADSCADGAGRIALRVRGIPAPREHERHEARYTDFDRPWWIVEAFDGAIAPTRVRLAVDDCPAALAAAPAPADWVRQTLGEPMPSHRENLVRLRTISVGADRHPKHRRLWAEHVAGAFIVAAHESLHVAEALDFTLRADAVPSESDLARLEPGADAYGPFDVFAAERERLRAQVERGSAASPDLEAHFFRRLVPTAGDPPFATASDVERWAVSLVEASPAADRRRAAAEAALTACVAPESRADCVSWRMAALGTIVARLRDPALCARAKSLATDLQASTDPAVAGAGAALARTAGECAAP